MLVWLGDMDEEASDKLEWVEPLGVLVFGFGMVEGVVGGSERPSHGIEFRRRGCRCREEEAIVGGH